MKSVTILAALLVSGVALGGVLPSPLSGSVLPSPLPGSEMEGGLGSPVVLHGCVHNVCNYSQRTRSPRTVSSASEYSFVGTLESQGANRHDAFIALRSCYHGQSYKARVDGEAIRLLQLLAHHSGSPNQHYYFNSRGHGDIGGPSRPPATDH